MRSQEPSAPTRGQPLTEIPNVLPGVLETVREHTRAMSDAPVGGILIGWVEGETVTIERAVPTPEAESHSGEIVFTPPCWDLAYSQLELLAPESRIVGWYHASPTHELELSAYDRSLHRTLFPDPAHVALIAHPGSEEVAWYGWEIEQITPLSAEPQVSPVPAAVGAAAAEAESPAQAAPRTSRPARAALALALLAAVALGAFLWGHSSAPSREAAPGAPTGNPTSAAPPGPTQQQFQQLQAEAESLRAELAQQAARLTATRQQLKRTKKALKAASKKPKPPATFVLRYRVQPGDTMFSLARTFYGNGFAWEKIWRANPSPDPNHIVAGGVLRIPLQNPA